MFSIELLLSYCLYPFAFTDDPEGVHKRKHTTAAFCPLGIFDSQISPSSIYFIAILRVHFDILKRLAVIWFFDTTSGYKGGYCLNREEVRLTNN